MFGKARSRKLPVVRNQGLVTDSNDIKPGVGSLSVTSRNMYSGRPSLDVSDDSRTETRKCGLTYTATPPPPLCRRSFLYRLKPGSSTLLSLNFLTSQGTGMEAFVSSQGALVVGVTTKKEFLAATVPDLTLLDSLWHCLDLCYMAARRPFGHNQLSVFIDGHQKLVAAMKFPALTEPFVLCTVGAAAARNYQPNQTRSDKSPSGIMERGIFPSIISQVPNYFSLPLRSSTPLDPHVKNFPPGIQDTIFGPPSSLQGQLGLICLFHEALQQHQIKTLFDAGPNCRLLFSPEDNAEIASDE
ncbi:neurobeachin-like protein 2 [Homalodisca vitripennis]|uniref:neurobeachin-like protein 2 n=1 Tax=Homalodisca vitripennis TaxID=197043 RepID=UPI001EE9FC2C|nr:neurobeachin-like protein 2 [Homalodisca vitripennis]